jgi:hypothetical protein
MRRNESHARGFRLPLLAAACFCLLALPRCHLEHATPASENWVAVSLHDSLGRFDSVEVLLLDAADTSLVLGRAWSGPLPNPSAIPDYRLPDGPEKPVAVRVRGFDSLGKLAHDVLILKVDGRQTIANLLPPPVAIPVPVTEPSVRLASLAVAPGVLDPVFDSTAHDYQVELAYDQSSITVTADAVTDSAAITVEGAPVAQGTPSVPIELLVGQNEISVRVTLGERSELYTVRAVRAKRVDPPDTVKPKDPDYAAWNHHSTVAVNVRSLGLGQGVTLLDFPLLIRFNRDNFDFGQAADSGRDLRFVHGGRELAYGISRWDTREELAEVWVRIDSIRGEADFDPIRMYWGNPAAPSRSNSAGVFDSAAGYQGVWHLDESGAGLDGEYRDATGRFHATGGSAAGNRTPRRSEGVVGHGQNFLFGGNPGHISLPSQFDPGDQWSWQTWIKVEGSNEGIIFHKGDAWEASRQRFRIKVMSGPGQQLAVVREGDEYVSNIYLPRGAFVHLGMVYHGGKLDVYVDGFLRESVAWTQGSGHGTSAFIGTSDAPGASTFTGELDEFWFSSRPHSAAWVRLAYENQRLNSYLVTVNPPSPE